MQNSAKDFIILLLFEKKCNRMSIEEKSGILHFYKMGGENYGNTQGHLSRKVNIKET